MSKILEAVNEVEEVIVGETKADTFRRLANKRVNNALNQIRLIGNLAGANYEYTPEQVNAIEDALRMHTDRIMDKFRKVKADKPSFEI